MFKKKNPSQHKGMDKEHLKHTHLRYLRDTAIMPNFILCEQFFKHYNTDLALGLISLQKSQGLELLCWNKIEDQRKKKNTLSCLPRYNLSPDFEFLSYPQPRSLWNSRLTCKWARMQAQHQISLPGISGTVPRHKDRQVNVLWYGELSRVISLPLLMSVAALLFLQVKTNRQIKVGVCP